MFVVLVLVLPVHCFVATKQGGAGTASGGVWWDRVLELGQERQHSSLHLPQVTVVELKRGVREASEQKMIYTMEQALAQGAAARSAKKVSSHLDLSTIETSALNEAMDMARGLGGPSSEKGKNVLALAEVVCELRSNLKHQLWDRVEGIVQRADRTGVGLLVRQKLFGKLALLTLFVAFTDTSFTDTSFTDMPLTYRSPSFFSGDGQLSPRIGRCSVGSVQCSSEGEIVVGFERRKSFGESG
jgi:hypothetical protein